MATCASSRSTWRRSGRLLASLHARDLLRPRFALVQEDGPCGPDRVTKVCDGNGVVVVLGVELLAPLGQQPDDGPCRLPQPSDAVARLWFFAMRDLVLHLSPERGSSREPRPQLVVDGRQGPGPLAHLDAQDRL